MEYKWSLRALVLCTLVLCNLTLSIGADATTQKAVPLANATTVAPATTASTTPKPKIKIADNDLCTKKCKCDVNILQIDCSNKNLTAIFTAEEWQTLQDGDVIFETINFNHNNISNIPILPTYGVKNLYLGFNLIKNISLGAFQNLTALTKLDLSHNSLTSKILVPDVFRGQYAAESYQPLKNLVELDLANNQLHHLNDDLFEHISKLQTLILCNNIFQTIDGPSSIAISSLMSLKTLDMSYMELSDIPETLFHGPNELETLLLSGNLFSKVPAALKYAKRLKSLVLDDNTFKEFKSGDFPDSLGTVTYLSIAFSKEATQIGPEALSVFRNLTTLIASDNPKLASIHELAFSTNTTNPDIFDYPPLRELHLNNNNLTKVERNWIQRWDLVKTINLRFNPWACDCTNSYLIHSLMKEINTTNTNLTHNVNCATPAAWKDKPLLELNADYKELICENTSRPEKDGLVLISILVGVLIGIPITLGALVIYRRGCFGIRNRINPSAPRYNRASFADDFHI